MHDDNVQNVLCVIQTSQPFKSGERRAVIPPPLTNVRMEHREVREAV
jgi:hypothetical protein